MNPKIKDYILPVLLLPAMILSTYWFLWSRPVRRALSTVETSVSKVGDVYEIHTQRLGLNNEQERLKIELATLQQEPESELMPVKPEAASALRRLQSVFQAHGVRMVSAAATTPLAHSSQSVDSVAKAFTDIGHKGAERWNVTLQAPYTAMVELLEVCATNAPPIVAESLTLSIAGGEKQAPYWTVRLCL